MSMKVKAWKMIGLIFIVLVVSQTINLVRAIGVTDNITSGNRIWWTLRHRL